MFADRFFPGRYFPRRLYPGGYTPAAGVGPFARRYFALRYFAARYFAAPEASPDAAAEKPGGKLRRTYRSWNRTVRYIDMAYPITRNTVQAHASDDRTYLFDLTGCPEIRAGDTIASAEILGDTAGLTIGAPEATTVALDGIDAGEAVQVVISGWTADTTYNLSCRVTFASGRKVVVPGRWVVAADY